MLHAGVQALLDGVDVGAGASLGAGDDSRYLGKVFRRQAGNLLFPTRSFRLRPIIVLPKTAE